MDESRTLKNETDEDNVHLTEQLAKCEEEKIRLMRQKNEVMKDFNSRMDVHVEEIRLLKQVNDKLQTDLEELRDLCCYLDDDRQKCRRLAREWQNFGRYISSTLQSKVNSYQEEINLLNSQQETITAENLNLKRLCRDLEERLAGDNSKREYVCIRCSQPVSLESKRSELEPKHSTMSSPTDVVDLEYDTDINDNRTEKNGTDEDSPLFAPNGNGFSKDSEQRGKVNGKKKKVSFVEPDEVSESDDDKPKHVPLDLVSDGPKGSLYHGILRNGVKKYHSNSLGSTSSAESDSSVNHISRAMQVLEIRSKLEEQPYKKQKPLKESEVAVIKEMCNVVWRKLSGDDPSYSVGENYTSTDGYADDVIYEDLL